MEKNSQNLIIQARKLIRNQKKGVLSILVAAAILMKVTH